jgi:hypothetical protein
VSGGTVSGKNIDGGITITGGTVQITDDCITSGDLYPIHFTGGGGVIDHVTVTGQGSGCSRAVEPAGSGPVVMDNMNISGCEDGIEMYDGDTLENSYIHDLAFFGGSHNDGVQQNGGSDDVVRHNTILNPNNQTSCVNFTTDFGPISNILITGNLLNGGNYTVYSRKGTDSNFGPPTGVSATDNRFGHDFGISDGGLLANDGPVTWSGNVSDSTGRLVSP